MRQVQNKRLDDWITLNLAGVSPAARAFIRSGLASLEHALAHARDPTSADAAQVIMSLAHAAEMLAKGAILHRGETIHVPNRPNRTISLREALDRLEKPKHAATMLVLVDRRDAIQHSGAYMDPETVSDSVETTYVFALDLLQHQLALRLENLVPPIRLTRTVAAVRETAPAYGIGLDPADAIQRDASCGAGITAWAQGEAQHNRLRVRARSEAGESRWLTPEEGFEYMPRTDGRHVVAYRQSGGIVLYTLDTGERRLLAETGGPGAIEDGMVAAQGLGIPDGLGGGIFLLSTEGGPPRQISERGDSPRISDGLLVWQEFRDEQHLILGQPLDGAEPAILVTGGQHPAIHEHLLAWTDVGARPALRARDLATNEQRTLSEAAILPEVRNAFVAFLEHRDDIYDLKVVDWADGAVILSVEDVGFPTGRGPLLTDTEVIWEARPQGSEGRLLRITLPANAAAT